MVPGVVRGLRAAARSAASWRAAGVVVGVSFAGLLVGSQFPAGGNDDSHITYWAAHQLAEGGKIANYNGLPVEQSSSLGLVVLLALLERATGIATPVLGWFTSLALGVFTIVLVSLLGSTDAKHSSFWPPVLVGTWLPFLYWSSSGMEMTLVTALGCAVVIVVSRVIDAKDARRRVLVLAALAGAAFVSARPETPIELVCMLAFCSALFARGFFAGVPDVDRRKVRRALALLAGAAALVAALVLLRVRSFGLVAPHPAIAKSGAFALGDGATYVRDGIALGGPLFALAALLGALALLGSFRAGKAPATGSLLLLGWCLSAFAFVLGSGGDWMAAARLLVPAAPALAVFAGEALAVLGKWNALAGHAAGAVLVVLNATRVVSFGDSPANASYKGASAREGEGFLVSPAAADFSFSELANRAHRRDARLLGPLLTLLRRLEPTAGDPVYLMSGQAGMVPYYVFRELGDRARFIDLYALTTPEILPCIPERHRKQQLQGIRISPGYVIDHAQRMKTKCGVGRPRIVYSTGRFPEYLAKRGYRRFYQGPPRMEAFVAVDADTLRKAGLP